MGGSGWSESALDLLGLTRLWFPSRSELSAHLGAFVMRLSGQVRSGRFTLGNGLRAA